MAATNLQPAPVAPIRGLSLYQIEAGMLELMQLWEDSEDDPGARATIEAEMARYVEAELVKVDGIRGYLKHLDVMIETAAEEVRTQSERGRLLKAQKERLAGMVMELMRQTKKPKIEGRTGSIRLQGNGGAQAVTVNFPDVLPEDCVEYVVPGELWAALHCTQPALSIISAAIKNGTVPVRRPNNRAIREALGQTCQRCNGNGVIEADEVTLAENPCLGCSGTGTNRVPGAYLEPRGQHLVVR